MSKLTALKSLKDTFDALIKAAPSTSDSSTQTDNEMHFSSGHCVAMATANGNAIIRYNNAITPDNSSIGNAKKGKKRQRSNSEGTLGTIGTFSASSPVLSLINPDELSYFKEQEEDSERTKQCACCGQDWSKEEEATVFGYTKPDAYGRSNVHTHCVGCRNFKKNVRNGSASPGDSSVVTTRLRHAILKRGINEVCVLRRNGETWKMAYQRLKSKHGDFLANRKDEMIIKLCKATGTPLEQGYVLYSHYSNIELFYRIKRLAPKEISSLL